MYRYRWSRLKCWSTRIRAWLVAGRPQLELGETPVGSEHYEALFSLGILLFVVTFIINLTADLVVRGVRTE